MADPADRQSTFRFPALSSSNNSLQGVSAQRMSAANEIPCQYLMQYIQMYGSVEGWNSSLYAPRRMKAWLPMLGKLHHSFQPLLWGMVSMDCLWLHLLSKHSTPGSHALIYASQVNG